MISHFCERAAFWIVMNSINHFYMSKQLLVSQISVLSVDQNIIILGFCAYGLQIKFECSHRDVTHLLVISLCESSR